MNNIIKRVSSYKDFYHWTCHERINAIPLLKEFTNKVAENDNYEIKNIKEFLNILKSKAFLIDIINFELDKLIKTNNYFPLQSSFTQFNIVDSEHFNLRLNMFKNVDFTKKWTMSSSPFDMCDTLMSDKPWHYKIYRCDNPYPLDIITEDVLVDSGVKVLNPFESIYLEKNKDIFVPLSKNRTFFILSLVSKYTSSFITEYDRKTLKPMRLVAGNHSLSRLQFACQILGEMGSKSSLKHLELLLLNSNYIIRWEAVKAIMLISFDDGLKALEKVKLDPHSEIRELSKKYLLKLKKY